MNMHVSRFWIVAHSVLLMSSFTVLLLAGCGGKNEIPGSDPNSAPVGFSDSYTMLSTDDVLQIGASLGVLVNDQDSDGDGLVAKLTVAPGNHSGEFILNADGGFSYTPDDLTESSDSFTYQASDGKIASGSTTVIIQIVQNKRPVATGDAYSLESPIQKLTVNAQDGVLKNDSDTDTNDQISAILLTPPDLHAGQFTLNLDGSFEYEFSGGDTLTDEFTYQVSDGKSESEPAAVQITIVPNVAPVAKNDCQVYDPAASITGNLTAFVSDEDAQDTQFEFTNITTQEQVNLGQITIDKFTGEFTYTSADTNEQGYLDTFAYQVDDLRGGVASGELQLIVGSRRIMPMGDSITHGTLSVIENTETEELEIGPANEEAVAYRQQLFNRLEEKKYAFDFVGNRTNGSASGLIDTDHQGVPGKTTEELKDSVKSWLDENPADTILLHIGTNDQSDDVSFVGEALDIVDQWSVDNNQPVTVLLAKIIDQRPFINSVGIFNVNLENLVATREAHVILVDQFAALDYPQDMALPEDDLTGLHPTQAGYDKMGDAWFAALESAGLVNRCEE